LIVGTQSALAYSTISCLNPFG